MYTIYTDKSEDFKCKIAVEGSKLNETVARLVIESNDVSLLFEGKIDSEGFCTVPIKRIKKVFSEGDSGKMRLEVIAEDTFFSPWEDEYTVKTNKKVTVEMINPENTIKESKSRVQVAVTPQPQSKQETTEKQVVVEKNGSIDHGKVISGLLSEKGITITNIGEKRGEMAKVIKEYSTKNKLKLDNDILIDEILDNLRF